MRALLLPTPEIDQPSVDKTAALYALVSKEGGQCVPLRGEDASPDALCSRLEAGDILYTPTSPFLLTDEQLATLQDQRQQGGWQVKNVAYRPAQKRLTGIDPNDRLAYEECLGIMQHYSQEVCRVCQSMLAPYAASWTLDFGTFRPLEEAGRKLRLRARNDLLHIDAFPTRPTFGNRILRVFTNIYPGEKRRIWQTGDAFPLLAARYLSHMPAYRPDGADPQTVAKRGRWVKALGWLGLKASGLSAYDNWMMRFHNALKENSAYQANGVRACWAFPPGSSWWVLTDTVSHAVLAGQYALEQTFILDQHRMLQPELNPINVLARLYGGTSQNIS